MKRGLVYSFLVTAILITVLLTLLALNLTSTGKAIFSPPIPNACTEVQIKIIWDTIFQETSNGITILSNSTDVGKCNAFFAYKIRINESWFMHWRDYQMNSTTNTTTVTAEHGNFTANSTFLVSLKSLTRINSDGITFPIINSYSIKDDVIPRSMALSQADSNFNTVFKTPPSSWLSPPSTQTIVYYFSANESNSTETRWITGVLNGEYAVEALITSNLRATPAAETECTPDWTAVNTSCTVNGNKTTYYTDKNNCNSNLNKPENITLACEYSKNGIIGNVTTLNQGAHDRGFESLSLFINGTAFDSSKVYNHSSDKIEIKESGSNIIEFNWDFSSSLNLTNVKIEKQKGNFSRGFLIVEGIPARKKVFVNKINENSTKACVKNQKISSISEISSSCTGTNEIMLDCPDIVNGIECEIFEDYFIVSNLANSTVIEMLAQIENCVPRWNCTTWTNCSDSIQTRSCNDLNDCNITRNRPPLNQTCTSLLSCTPNWVCSNWTECENSNQTRVCNDANSCETDSNKPAVTKTCNSNSEKSYIFTILIGTIILAIVIVIIILIYLITKKNDSYAQKSSFDNLPSYTPAARNSPS